MKQITKQVQDIVALYQTIHEKTGQAFVLEALNIFKKLSIPAQSPLSFTYHHVMDYLELSIGEKRISYSRESEIPFSYIKPLFKENYQTLYTREGISDFVHTFAKALENTPMVELFLNDVFGPANQTVNTNSYDVLAKKLFNLEGFKDIYEQNFDTSRSIKQFVNQILDEGLILDKVTLHNQPYTWLIDLTACAFIQLPSETSEGYPSFSLMRDAECYLYMGSELFKHLDKNIMLELHDLNNIIVSSSISSRYGKSSLKYEQNKYYTPTHSLLHHMFSDRVINFNYGLVEKTDFTKIFTNIFSHIRVPGKEASIELQHLLNSSYFIEYFTEGYNSDKGDQFFNKIINTLFKKESGETIQLKNERVLNIKEKLPLSYENLVNRNLLTPVKIEAENKKKKLR